MHRSLVLLLKRHRSFLIPFLLFIVLGAALQLVFKKSELFLIVNRNHNEGWDSFFLAYTWLGDGITIVVAALLVSLLKYRYTVLIMLAYLYTSLVAQLLKYLFNSPRPVKFFEGGEKIRLIEGLSVYSWKSFPSGHTVSAFAFAVVIAYLIPQKKWGWLIFLLFLPVAFSRVYLAQHFFQDIYAGAVIGTLLTFQLIVWLENQGWYKSEKLEGRLFG
ncbi:phosphatase PAP2 family protein [Pedobacter sp. SYSU D00535]|uniref:phosphatase PAP2 family protein n=1 Tax=Pedobacter sp. SYSU D00535 TaxID=2810308 RepID=UPI001A957725|nr:phosphatase PAP2 family protein [Pedobacter sp. SYSU D00535]